MKSWIKEFFEKITLELVNFTIFGKEILKVENYFVSDVIDTLNFTNRDTEYILPGEEINFRKLLNELYGDEQFILNIKKKNRNNNNLNENLIQNNMEEYKLKNFSKFYSQKILENQDSLYRAVINCYFFMINREITDISKISIDALNLGFYSSLQSNLKDLLKSLVIKLLKQEYVINNYPLPSDIEIKKIMIDDLIEIHKNVKSSKYWILELFCIHKIINMPIIVYDFNQNVILLFQNKEIFKNVTKLQLDVKSAINLQIIPYSYNNLIHEIYSLYPK